MWEMLMTVGRNSSEWLPRGSEWHWSGGVEPLVWGPVAGVKRGTPEGEGDAVGPWALVPCRRGIVTV